MADFRMRSLTRIFLRTFLCRRLSLARAGDFGGIRIPAKHFTSTTGENGSYCARDKWNDQPLAVWQASPLRPLYLSPTTAVWHHLHHQIVQIPIWCMLLPEPTIVQPEIIGQGCCNGR